MRWLFSADWQTEWENIDVCRQAWAQVLGVCRERRLEGVAFLGDLKRAYNPIDTRVTQFWMDTIDQAVRGYNLEVILLLGNHDRVGMYTDAQNWFPVLRHAGARVYDHIYSGALSCLPYTTQHGLWKKRAAKLAATATKDKVLLFHQELDGAYYNISKVRAESKFQAEDLHYKKYLYCLGGHIHRRQEVRENVFYVGSPFATDWGEVNQKKGFYVLEGEKLEFIPSVIPGWYDPDWPGFRPPKSWKGARVRIRVPVEMGKDFTKTLDMARMDAERRYSGAEIYAVPKVVAGKQETITVSSEDPDEKKVQSYVEQTLPKELRVDKSRVTTYLLYKLAKASGGRLLRRGAKIDFVSGFGKQVLCYPEVKLNYAQAGLVLVTGKNMDWPGGKSNGAGKSSLLSLLPIALFGTTFKGQKYDGWAMRGTKEKAIVILRFRDYKGREICIKRSRKPSALQLIVDGIDQSSGLGAAAGKDGTQGLIEQITGFTWTTLANSVYIDQHAVSTFLTGTARERKQVLERLQNLERFTAAHDLVKADLAGVEERLRDLDDDLLFFGNEQKDAKETLDGLPQEAKVKTEAAYKLYLQAKATHAKRQKAVDATKAEHSTTLSELLHTQKSMCHQQSIAKRAVDNGNAALQHLTTEVTARHVLQGHSNCPTCGMVIGQKTLALVLAGLIAKKNVAKQNVAERMKEHEEITEKVDGIDQRIASLERQRDTQIVSLEDAQVKQDFAEEAWKEWQKHEVHEKGLRQRWLRKLHKSKSRAVAAENAVASYERDKVFLQYATQAFSRDGLPAFLNEQLCPVLNRAADAYSEMFCDRHIQVQFSVKDGDFDISVINAHGGEAIEDQSAGEQKMAALITVFALREAAPQCNVLILDEPGDSLDPQNARAFASAIRRLKNRFGSIYLTSHNPNILGELSGEKVITIEKKNRVARLT